MQLPDVVQECQRGQTFAIGTGQRPLRGDLEPVSYDRQLQHPQEHGCDVHRMMDERVGTACFVGLTPGFAQALLRGHWF